MSRATVLIFLILPIIATFAGFALMQSTPAGDEARALSPPVPALGRSEADPKLAILTTKSGPAASVPSNLPASLRGTEPPAGWRVLDTNGDLVPTAELRALFEYYLAALGEESLEQLVVRIKSALADLPEPARSQAGETLARYLDYKLAVGDLEANVTAGEPETWLQQLRDMRRSHLGGATAEAFFSADEAVDRFQVERRRILADGSLDDEQRENLLARAEAALPEGLRHARAEARRFEDYHRARTELADDPAALQAYRETEFGAEAANALARVEQEQADWDRRWQAYRSAISQLESAGLAAPEREAAIQRLRDEYFQGAEKVRAQALDSLQ